MIKTRTLKVGQVLEVTYKGKHHECFVVKAADGKGLGFVLNKVEYRSISGAGKSLHGSRAIGGYGFWTLVGENDKPAKKVPAKKTASKKTATPKVNAVLASDDELAKEVALAGGAKKVAAKAAGSTPTGTAKSKKVSAPKVAK